MKKINNNSFDEVLKMRNIAIREYRAFIKDKESLEEEIIDTIFFLEDSIANGV